MPHVVGVGEYQHHRDLVAAGVYAGFEFHSSIFHKD